LNGERNGKGKEYYTDGRIKFEGEYLNDIRIKGKEYGKENNDYIFEGEYLYNFKKKGKEYIKEKLEFEGDYLCNKKWNGKGYLFAKIWFSKYKCNTAQNIIFKIIAYNFN